MTSVKAKEFPSEKALKDYLQDHPKADKSMHSVKKDDSSKDRSPNVTKQMKDLDKENPGAINWNYDPKKTKDKPIEDETDEEHATRTKNIKKKEKEAALRVAARFTKAKRA